MTAAAISPALPVTFRDLARSESRECNFVKKCWTGIFLEHRPAKVWPEDERKGQARKIARVEEHSYFRWLSEGPNSKIDRLMRRSRILVCVPNVTPNIVASFIAYEPDVLHFVYTTGTFRRMGLAKQLLAKIPGTCQRYSLWTPALDKLVKPGSMEWAPQEMEER